MLTGDTIRARALELGFDRCGIAPAADLPELLYLRTWLEKGYAGEMGYLARTAARRADVRTVLPSAQSVVALATVYNVDRPYSTQITDTGEARIARYAWGDDYHLVIGRRTDDLLSWMRGQSSVPFDARAYVDTGPVQERVYAQRAGLGWIGKNTCLIDPELGSWLFLSEIICSLHLEPGPPALDQCGACTLCLEACPTGAIRKPWVLDATRCLSYLTIEVKESLPPARRADVGSHVFGCDICQEVCPWNDSAVRTSSREWAPRAALDRPALIELWRRSDTDWRRALRKSALQRAGVRRLRRTVAVALGNSGNPDALAALDDPPGDSPTCADPLVTEHVTWAQRALRGRR